MNIAKAVFQRPLIGHRHCAAGWPILLATTGLARGFAQMSAFVGRAGRRLSTVSRQIAISNLKTMTYESARMSAFPLVSTGLGDLVPQWRIDWMISTITRSRILRCPPLTHHCSQL